MEVQNAEEDFFKSEWFLSRPEIIQNLCRQFPPNTEVVIKDTMQIGYLYSYFEDGTISVGIDAERSFVEGGHISVFGPNEDYRVFGLKPGDVEVK